MPPPLCRLVILALALLVPAWAWAFTPPPIEGHVTDPSHRLPPAAEAALAVFVAPSLGGETIEDVAHATFNTWGVGAKGKDNGVLLVWAPAERKLRIETGLGIGDRLPDVRASRIIRDVITPRFQEEEYARGIDHGTDAIVDALRGRPFVPGAGAPGDAPGPAASPVQPMAPWKKIGIGVFVVAYAVFMLRRASRPGGLGPGGGGGSSSGGSRSGGSSYSGGGGRSGGGGASGSY
jgi:uncharacterized protein